MEKSESMEECAARLRRENRIDITFRAVEHGHGDDAHACDACDNVNEPIARIGNGVYICAACMKGALGLLRGLGLTA